MPRVVDGQRSLNLPSDRQIRESNMNKVKQQIGTEHANIGQMQDAIRHAMNRIKILEMMIERRAELDAEDAENGDD